MLDSSLEQLFPQLTKFQPNPLSSAQFAGLPYFTRYLSLISQKQSRLKAEKVHKYFNLIKVKSGTVIYATEDLAQQGYILLSGCIQLLKKKNSREKTEMFPGHFSHSQQQKQNYLYQKFKIPKVKALSLLNIFYEQKIQFKYMHFHTIINRQQFGFGEMVRNTSRNLTAIATQQTQMLVVDKKNFDLFLRDFHQKKETNLVSKILYGLKEQTIEEMLPKLSQIMNSSVLLKYDNEDIIYQENEYPSNFYFLVNGEVQIRKRTMLTVPKKYMKHQIKDPIIKQVVIKISKIQKGSFFGQQEIYSARKERFFTIVSCLNESLVLKIDNTAFQKSINDFPQFEKMIVQNAVFKKANAEDSFQKQYNKIYSNFIHQYESYDSKKKQKMLSNLLKEGQQKNQLFEAYAPQGIFFRDTFQKLQGFEQDQKIQNKRSSIKRFKQKSSISQKQSPNSFARKQSLNQTFNQKIMKHEIQEKILFSPKKNMNVVEFYAEDINTEQPKKQSEICANQKKTNTLNTIKKQKLISKFQQIEKDEAIFKRVMIKNGIYPVDKKIDKSNSVKALVHRNFDEVVKQCVSRKNQALRRSSKQRQDQIVVESFHRAVTSLRSKSTAFSQLKMSRFTTPCKGTEQLKKRMQSIHNLGPDRYSSTNQIRKKSIISKIEDCIGVNQKPKSSQVSYRGHSSGDKARIFTTQHRSPEKIVLLNHMMKPIVYFNSTEL